MKATCIAHACFLQWEEQNYETLPVLAPAVVSPNRSCPQEMHMMFDDKSKLVISLANDGFSFSWSPPE
jgi:hypothetical protein